MGRQVERSRRPTSDETLEIERGFPDNDLTHLATIGGTSSGRAPQKSSDTRKKLLECERFRKVIVGAELEPDHAVDDVAFGREKKYWKLAN